MFSYDPEATNRALAATGSSYQVPVSQPVSQPAPTQPLVQTQPVATAAVPSVNVNTQPPKEAEPPPPPPPPKKEEEKDKFTSADFQNATNSMANMTKDPEKKEGFQKLGGLVGTVLSFYTGNVGGAKTGMDEMKDSGAQ